MTERDRSRQAPPGSPDAGDPVLSVVLPLEHVYGDVIRFLESWTTQTLARSRYAIIIAAPLGFDRQVLARVRGLLSDNDSLIEVAVENDGDEIPLWAAAAAAARSEWLFVTEAHCLAAPNCLSAVVESIEAAPPELAAITVGHDNAQDTRLRTIGGRWIDAVCGLRTESPWRPVVQFGTAIRSAIFAKLGGFDERAGVFSMALFGARLHEAGFSTGHLDGVFVTHLYEPTLRGAKAITLDFVYGECLKRAHDDAAHFDGYFGYAAEWGDRRRFEPAAARSVVASIARTMLERKARGRGLLRELVSWLPAALAGDAPFLLAAATRERASALAVKLPIGKGRSYRAFVRWHAAVVNGGRLRWQHMRASSLPGIDPADGAWTAEELGADTLVGVYGHERRDGATFRWLRPASLVRVAPSGPGGTVTLDTLGLRGHPLGYVQAVFAGGMRVPRDAVSGDSRFLRIALDEKLAAAAQRGGLTLLCTPLVPARAGQGDDRRLGIPVAAIAVEAAVRLEARACG